MYKPPQSSLSLASRPPSDPSGDVCAAGYHRLTHIYAPLDLVNNNLLINKLTYRTE